MSQWRKSTELLRQFLSLQPHDDIVIARQRDDAPPTPRLLRLQLFGRGVEWLDMPLDRFPRAYRRTSPNPPVNLRDGAAPVFRCDRDPAAMLDIYRFGDVMLVSKKVLSCLTSIDPEGFESAAAHVEGRPAGDYAVILPQRAIDVIDLPRTKVRLVNYLLTTDPVAGEVFSRKAIFPDGYSVREDIPSAIHLALNVYNADILMSPELVDRLAQCGTSDMGAIPTERRW